MGLTNFLKIKKTGILYRLDYTIRKQKNITAYLIVYYATTFGNAYSNGLPFVYHLDDNQQISKYSSQ